MIMIIIWNFYMSFKLVQQKFETLKAEGTEKVENEKKRFNETAQ